MTPLDWIQMHPKSAQSISLGANTQDYHRNGRFSRLFPMELMESLEHIQAYIDDLLCISRESFDNHLDKLEEVLKQLCNAGLKVNADNRHSAHLK
jgi:hypothetical protein